MFSTTFERSDSYLFEPETQGYCMTFRLCNLGSKKPRLYDAYVVRVASQLNTTVHLKNQYHQKSRNVLMCI